MAQVFDQYRWALTRSEPPAEFPTLLDAIAAANAASDLPEDASRLSVATDPRAGAPYEARIQTSGGTMFYLVPAPPLTWRGGRRECAEQFPDGKCGCRDPENFNGQAGYCALRFGGDR